MALLGDLQETLEDSKWCMKVSSHTDKHQVVAIIKGEKTPWNELPSDSDTNSEPDSDADDDVEKDETAVSHVNESTRGVGGNTEIQQLMSATTETITLLLRLVVAIRNPAPHDQCIESAEIETPDFEEHDINHVRQKFPYAERFLVQRLGRAISRRRQYLKYRQAHKAKLSHSLEGTERVIDEHSHTEVALRRTGVSTLPKRLEDRGYSYLTEDGSSKTGFLESLTVASTDSSKFICVHKTCAFPDRLFADSTTWLEHEKQHHLRYWKCSIETCQKVLSSKTAFMDHHRQEHQSSLSSIKLSAFADMHEQPSDTDGKVKCPICLDEMPGYSQLCRHLCEHQQEPALVALVPVVEQPKRRDWKDTAVALDDDDGLSDCGEMQLAVYNTQEQQRKPDAALSFKELLKMAPEELKEAFTDEPKTYVRLLKLTRSFQTLSVDGRDSLPKHLTIVQANPHYKQFFSFIQRCLQETGRSNKETEQTIKNGLMLNNEQNEAGMRWKNLESQAAGAKRSPRGSRSFTSSKRERPSRKIVWDADPSYISLYDPSGTLSFLSHSNGLVYKLD